MNATVETNTPLKFVDQISYKENDVVFKPAAKTPHGEVILVAAAAGEEIKAHSVDALAVITVIEGEVIFNVNGKEHQMKCCDTILVEPNTTHSVKALADSKIYIAKINA